MTKSVATTKGTKTAEGTKTLTRFEILNEIGMSAEDLKASLAYLKTGRYNQALKAAQHWAKVGDVCKRIKAAKIAGKLLVNCSLAVGVDLGQDELTYSIRIAETDGILEWFQNAGCTKHNPRTIFTAWASRNKIKKEKSAKGGGGRGKGGDVGQTEEDDKTKRYLDVAQAMTVVFKIYDRATLDGNLSAKELETLMEQANSLAARITEDAKLAIKAEKEDGRKAA